LAQKFRSNWPFSACANISPPSEDDILFEVTTRADNLSDSSVRLGCNPAFSDRLNSIVLDSNLEFDYLLQRS
jgi:hypothetical protein